MKVNIHRIETLLCAVLITVHVDLVCGRGCFQDPVSIRTFMQDSITSYLKVKVIFYFSIDALILSMQKVFVLRTYM